MTEYLRLEDLLALADDLGVLEVRDLGLLKAAAERPGTTLYAVDAYPDLETKAAVLLESLTRNHALVDGNMRLGWLATVVFLALNEWDLYAPDDEAYDLVIAVATGGAEPAETARQLRGWLTPVSR